MFETEKDVLNWYEAQPRALSAEFMRSIEWAEAAKHPLDPAVVSVLRYMRDVEIFTDIYYRELLRTPTGRDPVIRRFMDRWGSEEDDHGELINRFLNEAGVQTSSRWREEAYAGVPAGYTFGMYAATLITNCFGRYFSGAHMVWGAINEFTALQSYRRLWDVAGHPLLEKLLRAIAREESAHAKFYWSIARIRLSRSKGARSLASFAVKHFWTPVGEGTKPRSESDYVISVLFGGAEGVSFFDDQVSRRVRRLPGFEQAHTMTQRIADVSRA